MSDEFDERVEKLRKIRKRKDLKLRKSKYLKDTFTTFGGEERELERDTGGVPEKGCERERRRNMPPARRARSRGARGHAAKRSGAEGERERAERHAHAAEKARAKERR